MIGHLKKKILFGDDNSSSLMYLSLLLKRMGFHVVSVKNGLDALNQLEAIDPDLIMLDIDMPDLDGTKVLSTLKINEKTRDIPVVMISTDANQETIEKCKALGCAGYLVKPIQVEKLYATIETCIVFSSERKNRRHLRVPFNKKIRVEFIGLLHELYAESIAEGGLYIMKKEPFPPGSELALTIPISAGESLSVKGMVVYVKGIFGKGSRIPAGMAVEFTNVSPEISEKLQRLVKHIIAGDVIDDQDEPVVE